MIRRYAGSAGLVVALALGACSAPVNPSSTAAPSSGAGSSSSGAAASSSASGAAESSSSSGAAASSSAPGAGSGTGGSTAYASGSATPSGTGGTASTGPTRVWPDNGAVSHLFYHSLVVDPARAFHSRSARGYADYMVTLPEFTAQLEQIYARGYVLVDPQRLAAPDAKGVMRYVPLRLPVGKKPLVLSIDDVSYYEYMTGDGFASDLFVDADGRVRNHYTDAAGRVHVGAYDVSTVVDDFVRAHPDFSYRGDKGVFALTGYNGVLGYRSSVITYGDTPKTRAAIAAATTVAQALHADGWRFASHSWGHIDFRKSSLGRIEADARRWDAEVRPIVGRTPMIIFAFGADIAGLEHYGPGNAKYRFLNEHEGFRYIFPIDGSTTAWGQLTATSLRQARINIDGLSMARALRGHRQPLESFFDVRSVLDSARRGVR